MKKNKIKKMTPGMRRLDNLEADSCQPTDKQGSMMTAPLVRHRIFFIS